MSSFCLQNQTFFLVCGALLLAAVILQSLNLSYGFRPLEQEKILTAEHLMEISVLFELLVMVLMVAYTSFHAQLGFAGARCYPFLRSIAFAALTGLTLWTGVRHRNFINITAMAASGLILPAAERLAFFPTVFLFCCIFWLLRSLLLFIAQFSRRGSSLTALSIKEALDRLDSGLLFCRKDGRIILKNRQMQELMETLTDTAQYNGRDFYQMLEQGAVAPGCTRDALRDEQVCHLPDGHVWRFTRYDVAQGRRRNVLLLASDITERWEANDRLLKQDRELEKRNAELQKVLLNLDEICRSETVLQAKSRVHDVLGQSISLLLRSMREHREPDEVLLQSFAEGLPRELKEVTADGGYSLDTLAKVFHNLGITVHVDGWLPADEIQARTFYEIAVEAVTNAVRHGYATEISIAFSQKGKFRCMDIENQGLPIRGSVIEGGGLKGMREKALHLGGHFSYESADRFHIHVELPGGEMV